MKSDVSSVQPLFSKGIINCFCFLVLMLVNILLRNHKYTEGNPRLMSTLSKKNTYQAYVDYLYLKMLAVDVDGLLSD